jgi:hypothetical protein
MMTLPKNLNIFWAGYTALAVWFLFIHAPPIMMARGILHDGPFAYHLLGAYTINIACIVNTMLTPSSLNGKARRSHVIVGRIGMIAGVLGFVFGCVCSWWPTRDRPPIAFSIGVTIGGAFQVLYQFLGYRAIRKYQALKQQIIEIQTTGSDDPDANLEELKNNRDDALASHISNMIALFVLGCSSPGMLRLLMLSRLLPPMIALIGGIALNILVVRPYANVYINRMKPRPADAPAAQEEPLLSTAQEPLSST